MYNAEKLNWINANFPAFISNGYDILSCLDYNIEYDSEKDVLKISSKCLSEENNMPLASGIIERNPPYSYMLRSKISFLNGNKYSDKIECQSFGHVWNMIAKLNKKLNLEEERCGGIDWIGIYEKFKEKGAFKDYSADFLYHDRSYIMLNKPNAVIIIRKENGSWLIACGDETKETQLKQHQDDIIGLLEIQEGQLKRIHEGSSEKLIKKANDFLNKHPKIERPEIFWFAGSAISSPRYHIGNELKPAHIVDYDDLDNKYKAMLPEQPEYAKIKSGFVIPEKTSSITFKPY